MLEMNRSHGMGPRALHLLVSVALVLLSGGAAWAQSEPSDEKVEACFSAYEETQIQLKANAFSEARDLARSCSQGCPEEISQQCQKWVWQAERDAPSVLLVARLAEGDDAPGVTVAVDGEWRPLQKEVLLNPGEHTFRFSRDDGWEDVRTLTIHPGEKRRTITATVQTTAAPEPSEPPEPQAKNSHIPWAVASLSLGAVGLGVAGAFTLVGLDKKSQLEECAGSCAPQDVESAHQMLTIADVGLVVGAVGVAAGLSILIWGKPKKPSNSHVSVALLPTSGGAAGSLSARF
jgi:hypothetical protein